MALGQLRVGLAVYEGEHTMRGQVCGQIKSRELAFSACGCS